MITVSSEQSTDRAILIRMLGGFQLVVDDRKISDSINRTRQLWNLLGYLIAFRHKTVPQEALIEALWPDDRSEHPATALKNLVYRIRNIFCAHDIPNAKEMIIFYHGTYCWNNHLNCVVDTEQFEQLKHIADDVSLPPELRVERYLEAIDLYKGNFLPASCYEEWVIPLASYYRSLYFKCVYEANTLLNKLKRFDCIQTICEKAIIIDPFEERAHKYLIYALVKQNHQQEALKHYHYVCDLFYRELGVKPSESMRNLYSEIAKSVHSVETDLDIIKEDLIEHRVADGAFYCDYEVFKNMYQLEARVASRTGQSVFLGLLTVTNSEGNVPEKALLCKAMGRLLETICGSLRKGDIVSRFSSSQYVLMLPTLTFENGQMVMHRICKHFREENHLSDIKVSTTLQPLDPIM
ncbi:BTAD domain-containing putative transcriptional regulator [Oscillospiraceae bacterium PP1C4]